MNAPSKDYQRGYAAGKRKAAIPDTETRKERVFLACLEMALKHCSGWQIAGEPIRNAEGYCKLARVFAENGISEIERL